VVLLTGHSAQLGTASTPCGQPSPNLDTVAEFRRRLGHPTPLVGLKPTGDAPRSTVVWPVDLSERDFPDIAAGLGQQYRGVYSCLNPLRNELLSVRPPAGWSVRDSMVSHRSRLLIDVDCHDDGDLATAYEQAEAIEAKLGKPIMFNATGRGFALVYPVELANTPESTQRVRQFLAGLKAEFPLVDDSVVNAARLIRVAGTLNIRPDGQRIATAVLR